MLEPLISLKPQIRLNNFFLNVTVIGHLGGFKQVMNESAKAIIKELDILLEAGYLKLEAIQNRVNCKIKYTLLATLQKNSFPAFGTLCLSYDAFGVQRSIEIFLVTGDSPVKMMVKP